MKTVYVCEKCGTSYDDHEEAYKCEESHVVPAIFADYREELNKRATWRRGDTMPRTCVIPSEYKYAYDPDTGNYKGVVTFALYEFKRMLKNDEVQIIEKERAVREQKEREESQRWHEDYMRRKAEKEAAEAEAAEAVKDTEAQGEDLIDEGLSDEEQESA